MFINELHKYVLSTKKSIFYFKFAELNKKNVQF